MGKVKLILLTFFIFISLVSSQESESKNRKLNYYLDGILVYSIEEKMGHINIVIKEKVDCVMAPCIFPVIGSTEIVKEKEYESLKSVLDEIFNKTKVNEKSVTDDDLSDEQVEKIFKVLTNNNMTSKLEYHIVNNLGMHYNMYSERGYYYQNARWQTYTISAGRKPTSGFSINIKSVKIKWHSATVYVKEYEPNGPSDDVLTYPIVRIRFNINPSSITIINSDNGKIYPKIR
jgi:hypothetical protein